MADDNNDGISEEQIAELIAEAENGYDNLIPRPVPPNIDGIRRCKVDLEDWNYHTVWDVADKRQLTFDEALNWIIAYGASWAYPSGEEAENRADKETPEQKQHKPD